MAAALGSTNPHPVLPACLDAATAEHTPTVGLPAQQAELQSASEVQPPVMNCWPLAWPTFFAPALFGVTANVVNVTGEVSTAQCNGRSDLQARVARIEMRTIFTGVKEQMNECKLKRIVQRRRQAVW